MWEGDQKTVWSSVREKQIGAMQEGETWIFGRATIKATLVA